MGRESARSPNEARDALLAGWALRMAAANNRMAELERELVAAREQSSYRKNEIETLRLSLDLSARENARLFEQLSKSSVAVEKRTSQLAQARVTLRAAADEQNESGGKVREQIAVLNAKLEAMTARATAAEKLVSETQQNLLASSAENSRAQRRLASMQISLQEAQTLVKALKQAQAKLLEQIKSGDAALTRAEERIASLGELFLQLEARAAASAAAMAAAAEGEGEDEEQQHGVRGPERLAEEIGDAAARTNSAILKRDLDGDAWLFGRERLAS